LPCYNVEPYVERAINSVVSQTYENIEIIAVNDGSSDNTLQKLKSLNKRVKNLRIINQKNCGYGTAVQNGIDASHGEFVIILEPDDYWDNFYLEPLVREAVGNCSDAVFYNSYFEVRSGFRPRQINQYFHGRFAGPYELTASEIEQRLVSGATGICFALYSKKFISTYKIKLNTQARAYEDVSFIYRIMLLARKISIIPGGGYFYCRDIPGQSVTSELRFESLVKIADEIIGAIKPSNARTPALIGYLLTHLNTYYWKSKNSSLLSLNSVISEKSKLLAKKQIKVTAICNSYLKDILKISDLKTQIISVGDGYKKIPTLTEVHSKNDMISFLSFCKWKLSYYVDHQKPLSHFVLELFPLLNTADFSKVELIKSLFLDILSREDFVALLKKNSNYAMYIVNFLRSENVVSNILPYLDTEQKKVLTCEILNSRNFPELCEVNEFQDYMYFYKLAFKHNLQKFHSFLKGKNITIVGNSPCETNKGNGKLIDQADVVLRFNNYSVDPSFSEDYGEKIDCWAITPKLETIRFKSNIGSSRFVITPFCNNYSRLFRIKYLMMFQRAGIDVVYFPVSEILWKYNMTVMSLGLLTILYILDNVKYKSLNICGFNLSEQLDGVKHYYSGDPSRGKKIKFHDWMKEALILNQLLENKTINHV
jgi:glycosyltransferase involved in cell wall biosynthesis